MGKGTFGFYAYNRVAGFLSHLLLIPLLACLLAGCTSYGYRTRSGTDAAGNKFSERSISALSIKEDAAAQAGDFLQQIGGFVPGGWGTALVSAGTLIAGIGGTSALKRRTADRAAEVARADERARHDAADAAWDEAEARALGRVVAGGRSAGGDGARAEAQEAVT